MPIPDFKIRKGNFLIKFSSAIRIWRTLKTMTDEFINLKYNYKNH
jgi:hypothetical protein